MPLDEITIEVRESSISIQGAGIANNQEEARDILQAAISALDSDEKKDTHTNEIVVKTT